MVYLIRNCIGIESAKISTNVSAKVSAKGSVNIAEYRRASIVRV